MHPLVDARVFPQTAIIYRVAETDLGDQSWRRDEPLERVKCRWKPTTNPETSERVGSIKQDNFFTLDEITFVYSVEISKDDIIHLSGPGVPEDAWFKATGESRRIFGIGGRVNRSRAIVQTIARPF